MGQQNTFHPGQHTMYDRKPIHRDVENYTERAPPRSPHGYKGIEYILLLWGEDKGASKPRLGDIYTFGRLFEEENLPWVKEKLFLEKQYPLQIGPNAFLPGVFKVS